MHRVCLLTSMELIICQTAAYCICILMIRSQNKIAIKKIHKQSRCVIGSSQISPHSSEWSIGEVDNPGIWMDVCPQPKVVAY